jgi:hypothetical protein
MANPSPTSLKDVLINRLLLCTLPQFFIADLVGPADFQDLPQAGVNEDLDFLHVINL